MPKNFPMAWTSVRTSDYWVECTLPDMGWLELRTTSNRYLDMLTKTTCPQGRGMKVDSIPLYRCMSKVLDVARREAPSREDKCKSAQQQTLWRLWGQQRFWMVLLPTGSPKGSKQHQTYSSSSKWGFLEGADEQYSTTTLLSDTALQFEPLSHLQQCKLGLKLRGCGCPNPGSVHK